MKFKAEIDLDNSAFENPTELSRLLEVMILKIGYWTPEDTNPTKEAIIKDINGSKVGSWQIGQ